MAAGVTLEDVKAALDLFQHLRLERNMASNPQIRANFDLMVAQHLSTAYPGDTPDNSIDSVLNSLDNVATLLGLAQEMQTAEAEAAAQQKAAEAAEAADKVAKAKSRPQRDPLATQTKPPRPPRNSRKETKEDDPASPTE